MIINISKKDRGKFTQDERRLFQLLHGDLYLEHAIHRIRASLEIPKSGLKSLTNYKQLESSSKRSVAEFALRLTHLYGLETTYWLSTFVNIILFNQATPPKKDKYPPIDYEVLGPLLRINVREVSSVSQIIQFIEKNSSKIKEALIEAPKPVRIDVKNIDIKIKILALKQEGRSLNEITDILEAEYPELPFKAYYEIVNAELVRFESYLKSLHKPGPEAALTASLGLSQHK